MNQIKIAHISDLHFEVENQKERWLSLKNYINKLKPDYVLVTGDIVDSPDHNTYVLARNELDGLCKGNGRYLVCAGNHDRHPVGNALGKGLFNRLSYKIRGPDKVNAWFTEQFKEHIPDIEEPKICKLNCIDNEWNIRVIAIDSSKNSQYSARGFISMEDLEKLRKVLSKKPSNNEDKYDLTILMVHHHLLPIASLEKRINDEKSDILNLVTLANAGTVLDILSEYHVDIVLHGHQHTTNYARYATLNESQTDTTIIGCGSSTGAVTLKGCIAEKASFNLIELYKDRSIWISEHKFVKGDWCKLDNSRRQIRSSQAQKRAMLVRNTNKKNRLAAIAFYSITL